MQSRTIKIISVLLFLFIAAILIFVIPGIMGTDPHIYADKIFLKGANCEFKQDYTCAIAQYQFAINTYKQDSRYYTHLAQVQRKQGDYAAAIKTYQKAKEVNPSDENVLPGLNLAISQQATQTALPPAQQGVVQPAAIPTVISTPLPESVFPIFDEDFGIIGHTTALTEAAEDNITYAIVEDQAYSGKRSLLISWQKFNQHWASVILGFDSQGDSTKAAVGQMTSINLFPPSKYAIQFFAKRSRQSTFSSGFTLMDGSITVKFQDQNILIEESVGNQAIYIYQYDSKHLISDGRLKLIDGDWQEFCLPLDKFSTDHWVTEKYKDFTEADRIFDWSNVKQINIDADFFSTEGAVYIDAMRIIRASDCMSHP